MADTKIETYRKLNYQFKNNKVDVQYCLGKKRLEDGEFVRDPNNDKHDFCFRTDKHHSSKPIYLDAYYGYYGNSNVSMFNNDFYMECLAKALNTFIPQIISKTEEIMNEECNKALLEAKEEAEDILQTIKELE